MRNILTTILLLAALTVAAQNYSPCYKEKYAQGVELYNKGDYNGAKAKFVAAKGCPMANTKEVDEWIKKCNKAIEETEKARQELEAFESCKSVEACNRYLDRYPNGKYVTQVRQKKQELQAEDIAYNGCVSIETCDKYLKKYPNGRYVADVKRKKQGLQTEDDAYKGCVSIEKCDEYLNKYSKGRYVAEVKRKREELLAEETKRKAENEAKGIYEVNGITFKMIYVQGGTFQMGCTSEQGDCTKYDKPKHKVTLSDFWMGETEVTQALWKAVMGSNPSYFKGDDLPVDNVTWDECQKFISKLNSLTGKKFRLPTEAEWEFAARGGNKSQHYKYAGSNTIGDVAWYDGNSEGKTHLVKTKKANELGLYDMSGNVWEWCSDRYGDYSSSAQTNPQGPSTGSVRVLRGGSWGVDDGARYCRVAYRDSDFPSNRFTTRGFRLALVHQ